MRSELVIRFIGHLQIVTTSNYSAVTTSHTLQFTTACTESSQSNVSSAISFQWWTFPFLWVSEMSLCLSYQLLHSSALTNSLTHSSANSPHSTPLHCTALTTHSTQSSDIASEWIHRKQHFQLFPLLRTDCWLATASVLLCIYEGVA
jgi:hypothetical protein